MILHAKLDWPLTCPTAKLSLPRIRDKQFCFLAFFISNLYYYNYTFLLYFYTVPTALRRCMPASRIFVRSFVCACVFHEMCYFVPQTKDWTKKGQFLHKWTMTRFPYLSIFIKIVNVLELHLKGQTFEESTFGSSNMIIS